MSVYPASLRRTSIDPGLVPLGETGGQIVRTVLPWWKYLAASILLSAGASAAQPPAMQSPADTALLLEIRDAIGPATSEHKQ